ncbi:Uncharacterised protein [Slackia heliotrinireducens]|uniref:Uncharacterized protein n=1 Tax=Slackia heliotrinireducens (strain ATCC 29202 / DSM 20476 / NCTC 11029 / RHS 1) TaxID=471855 RepID=C7N3E2_SLAHD|nr:hypothetical protein [Slackia heliotrinireducens]ACV23665.1 hypothetical protein Shel_26660 [Slackia heliotrinireducens DSM 20476]VEH03198.1 Uncharacterised protein [Slackia heliotrinireducens]
MEARLSEYDERVLRRLIQIETQNRRDGKQEPLAYVRRDTQAGASMRRLDQLGLIAAQYREGNPLVLEVLGLGYSYVSESDAEHADIARVERYRQEDRRHDIAISVLTAIIGIAGVVIGFFLGRF